MEMKGKARLWRWLADVLSFWGEIPSEAEGLQDIPTGLNLLLA